MPIFIGHILPPFATSPAQRRADQGNLRLYPDAAQSDRAAQAGVPGNGHRLRRRNRLSQGHRSGIQSHPQGATTDFFPQQHILRIVRDAGVPIFVKPGFEADDLIATMTKRLEGQGFEVFLVSKDKDLRQLLDDATKMYDVQADEVIDAAAMEAKCGYTPLEAVEVQTLTGDATDNVKGIPGIGEKTAAKLVKKYGSAEAVLQHLDELTPKMRENFEKLDMLPITRQLVTLKNDVEMEFDPGTAKRRAQRRGNAATSGGTRLRIAAAQGQPHLYRREASQGSADGV